MLAAIDISPLPYTRRGNPGPLEEEVRMTEEERSKLLGEFRGKTINRVTLLHEDEEEFNDVLTLEFTDMSKVSFTLHGGLDTGPR